jgi:uncharacterized phage protein (TIGR01671 family)
MNNKFKIWIKKEKRFITDNFEIHCFPKQNKINIIKYTKNHFYHYNESEIDIIHSVNRKDIDDKEIYEGDILEGCVFGYDGDYIMEFSFIEIAFVLKNIEKNEDGYEDSYILDDEDYLNNFKYIGNIYENEDLYLKLKNNKV